MKEVPTLPSLPIFDLILSFPLLEDLTLVTYQVEGADNNPDGPPDTALPPTPPMTGSLHIFQGTGIGPFARRLLSLPGDIHFWELALTLVCEEDLLSSTALVEGCSQTIEYLDISCEHLGVSIRHRTCIAVLITCLFQLSRLRV